MAVAADIVTLSAPLAVVILQHRIASVPFLTVFHPDSVPILSDLISLVRTE